MKKITNPLFPLDIARAVHYNKGKSKSLFQGGVEVPTGGDALWRRVRELWHEPVRSRYRRYSPEGRNSAFFARRSPMVFAMGFFAPRADLFKEEFA